MRSSHDPSKSTTPQSLVEFGSFLSDDEKLRELGRQRLARAIRAVLEERLGALPAEPHVSWDDDETLPRALSEPEARGDVEPECYWVNLEVWNKMNCKDDNLRQMDDEELRRQAEQILTPEERQVIERLGGVESVMRLQF